MRAETSTSRTTTSTSKPEFDCIREKCILDNDDPYHFETHLCFVCGYEFMPTPEMRGDQCPVCGWYKCPVCDGCKCNLSEHDQQWVDWVHCLFCQDIDEMASVSLRRLPATDNPRVLGGLGLQLLFCKRWALARLSLKARLAQLARDLSGEAPPDTLLGRPITWNKAPY